VIIEDLRNLLAVASGWAMDGLRMIILSSVADVALVLERRATVTRSRRW
jgi:hypothetical protein